MSSVFVCESSTRLETTCTCPVIPLCVAHTPPLFVMIEPFGYSNESERIIAALENGGQWRLSTDNPANINFLTLLPNKTQAELARAVFRESHTLCQNGRKLRFEMQITAGL